MIENSWDHAPKGLDSSCETWKRFAGNNDQQTKLLGYFDAIKTKVADLAKQRTDQKTLGAQLLDLLQKRKDLVDKQLAAKSTQTSVTNNLWEVLTIIGIFSLGTIVAVKFFSEKIQVEWVASGQVIQFVTVMILLSVVMALGLAGILKENTLGTLLGGIAGYVLAQGVGRAAAREVTRGTQQAAAQQGPGPDGPGPPPA